MKLVFRILPVVRGAGDAKPAAFPGDRAVDLAEWRTHGIRDSFTDRTETGSGRVYLSALGDQGGRRKTSWISTMA
jgi:hypothetical protein